MWHRTPVVAGAFYPADAHLLSADIQSYLQKAEVVPVKGTLYGIIAPHAGYVYSGPVAAYSYKLLKNMDIDVAVVLAPSHRARFNGASVIPRGIYETPLGEVEIDADIGTRLVEKNNFSFIKEAHQAEHSLEVQVPFLQSVLSDFTIVPVIIGSTELATCGAIAESLYDVLKDEKRNVIIVVSTDLSHYHDYSSAKAIDEVFINSLKSFNPAQVEEVCAARKAEACGEGPVLTGMTLCKQLGADTMDVLNYANSGDAGGGKGQVVGYVAAAMSG